jgi:16S rRNA processing protein RimM
VSRASVMADDDLLLIGRVARAHGNRGQVIVNPETDFPEARFRAGQVVLMGPETAPTPREITSVRFHQGRPIVGLAGVETMNDAEALAGAAMWMPAAALGPLPARTFYRHDLVGCDVFDRAGAAIGRVTGVEGTIDRSCLVVGDGVMIPMVEGICVDVDPAAGRIVVDPPEGLLDLNSRSKA